MREVYIPRRVLYGIVLGIISIMLFLINGIKIISYHHPHKLTELSKENIKSNMYVSGDISSYVISPLANKNTDTFESFWVFGDFTGAPYKGIIVPIGDGKFILAWVNDSESLELLKQIQDGLFVDVPFMGKVIDCETNDLVITDEMLGFDHNKVIREYSIQQTTIDAEKFWCANGFLGMVVAVLIYIWGDKIVVREKETDSDILGNVHRNYNSENELMISRKRIEMYNELENTYRRKSYIGCFCIVIGIAIIRFSVFPAIIFFSYGICKIWKYFINSTNRLAVRISKTFNINTVQEKKAREYKTIQELEKS